jgi:hypothetical protein
MDASPSGVSRSSVSVTAPVLWLQFTVTGSGQVAFGGDWLSLLFPSGFLAGFCARKSTSKDNGRGYFHNGKIVPRNDFLDFPKIVHKSEVTEI